ncbi:hypothetical protein ACHHYP_04336 [Achlya hypogyna]|nr:hypothetical protein ACHHYP_04336 [Achlya hypogyna]
MPPPVIYTPVRPVVFVPAYRPVGYSYIYFAPPLLLFVYYPIIFAPTYWNRYPCHQTNCQARYNQCLAMYGNDGCVCYPGFLQCVNSNCYNDYTPAVQQCQSDLANANRCVLSCAPQAYPDPAVAPVQYALYSTVWIQGLTATAFADHAYDFTTGVVEYLGGNGSVVGTDPTMLFANVTLSTVADVVVNGTSLLQIDVFIKRPSYDALNTTATKMMALVTNQTMDLQTRLVTLGVLFEPTQLSVQTSQTSVDTLTADGALVLPDTTGSGSAPSTAGSLVSGNDGASLKPWTALSFVLSAVLFGGVVG